MPIEVFRCALQNCYTSSKPIRKVEGCLFKHRLVLVCLEFGFYTVKSNVSSYFWGRFSINWHRSFDRIRVFAA